jgi:two-component system nitrate/nitrite response regulator NarL
VPESGTFDLLSFYAGLTEFNRGLSPVVQKARPICLAEAGLTEKEDRILKCLIEGKSNKLIARDMGIAENTVKVHVRNLLKKLNLRSRVEAAVWANRCRCVKKR